MPIAVGRDPMKAFVRSLGTDAVEARGTLATLEARGGCGAREEKHHGTAEHGEEDSEVDKTGVALRNTSQPLSDPQIRGAFNCT